MSISSSVTLSNSTLEIHSMLLISICFALLA
nr:MAG TPA: hypothetical protein [Caudoviricetes sp.]DAY21407.1 MAG TPA: hypothetical protein [Caudoviricetes sp.]